MKALIIGAAISALAGAAAGDGLQPVLARPPAPMEAAAFGASAYDAADPAGVWTRPGPVPVYVVGTGWLPRQAPPRAEPAIEGRDLADAPPEVFTTPNAVQALDAPPAPSAYPSIAGDIMAGIARPEPVPEDQPPPPSA